MVSLLSYRYFAPLVRSLIVNGLAYLLHFINPFSLDFRLKLSYSFIYLFLKALAILPVYESAKITNLSWEKSI